MRGPIKPHSFLVESAMGRRWFAKSFSASSPAPSPAWHRSQSIEQLRSKRSWEKKSIRRRIRMIARRHGNYGQQAVRWWAKFWSIMVRWLAACLYRRFEFGTESRGDFDDSEQHVAAGWRWWWKGRRRGKEEEKEKKGSTGGKGLSTRDETTRRATCTRLSHGRYDFRDRSRPRCKFISLLNYEFVQVGKLIDNNDVIKYC